MTQADDTPRPDLPAEVYFDGACPVCRAEIAAWRTAPALSETAWRDVAGPDAPPEGVSRQDALARFHVRLGDGTVVSGARAFLALWRASRRLRPLGVALDRQPFVAVLDAAYTAFLRVRPIWRRQPSTR